LIEAFRARFPNETLTIGLLSKSSVTEEFQIAKDFARYIGEVGIGSVVIAGPSKASYIEAFRGSNIQVRPVSFAHPIRDLDGRLPVVMEGEGRLNHQYFPVWAKDVESLEDPIARAEVRFMQVFSAAVLALLMKDSHFAQDPSLLRAELLKILGRSGYENVVTSIGDGLNINPIAYQLMMQAFADSELTIAA
jgi:hypothetical protein